eukprot:Tbor_TRINITY_DN4587_c0_g1::TRINITY_DN4587_c0_g1_i1::g.15867::m.15867
MGVFQSIGGSSTSGKGFRGNQVTAAIIATLLQCPGYVNKEKEVSGIHKVEKPLTEDIKVTSLDYDISELSEKNDTKEIKTVKKSRITVTEYCPETFRQLRLNEGTSDETFIDEWDVYGQREEINNIINSSCENPASANGKDYKEQNGPKSDLELGDGRSMAMFLKSKSMTYMLKTIGEQEVKVLLRLLCAYRNYIIGDPNGVNGNTESLLIRFVMLLKIVVSPSEDITVLDLSGNKISQKVTESPKEIGYILIFSDIFSSCNILNERWDIKGRRPKPGKYRHFPRHINTEKPNTMVSEVSDENDGKKLITRKDKDLTRKFWIGNDASDQYNLHNMDTSYRDLSNLRERLVTQLKRDTQFLAHNGLMDYSILVGVRYNHPFGEDDSSTTPDIEERIKCFKMKFALGEESLKGLKEVRPPTSKKPDAQVSIFHEGINSLEGAETYYIGIIDMLTEYTWKKKAANLFKSFLWREKTLSTIPPIKYAVRINKYIDIIFPIIIQVDEDKPE